MTETLEQSETNSTKSSILSASRKLFSTHGLQGTSMKMLAAEAGINQSLIHYHFGSKRDLWMTVYSWYSEELVRMTGDCAAFGGHSQPLSELIDFLYAFAEAYPEYGAFVTWAAMEPDIKFPEQAALNWAAILEGIETAQQRGIFRTDISAQMIRSVVSASVFDGFRIQTATREEALASNRTQFKSDLKKILGSAFHASETAN